VIIKNSRLRFTCLATFLIVALPAFPQKITRGPYLQMQTENSIMICWRTDWPTGSLVRYGTDPAGLNDSADSAIFSTEHRVSVKGLEPATKYYYDIELFSSGTTADKVVWHFETAPPSGSPTPFRAWFLGDFGRGSEDQAAVRNSFIDYRIENKVDFWAWLGDNAYESGTDKEYQDKVFSPGSGYATIFPTLPFFPSPGNHDYKSINSSAPPNEHTGPYYDIVEVPQNGEIGGQASGSELYYSFDYANTHFISFNSELKSWFNSKSSPMLNWLRNDLGLNKQTWTVFYCHIPPYSKGSHNSDHMWESQMLWMRLYVVPILEEYGVDLVLGGHSHVYERSMLIQGHDDSLSSSFDHTPMVLDGGNGNFESGNPYWKYSRSNEGTVYVVCGNGGSVTTNPGLDHPAMAFSYGCDTCLGSFLLNVDGQRLDGEFLSKAGKILDHFTILKFEEEPELSGQETVFNVIVRPNPVSLESVLIFEVRRKTSLEIMISDAGGREFILHPESAFDAGIHEISLSTGMQSVSAGTYSLVIRNEQETFAKRMIKFE